MTSDQTASQRPTDPYGMTEPWQVGDPSISTIQEPRIHHGNCQHEQIAHLRNVRQALDAWDGPLWPWMFGTPKEGNQ